MYNYVANSCQNVPVLGSLINFCADIIGWVMDLLFQIFGKFGIESVGLCIIMLTVIVKLAMLPLTIKQQKFSKVSSMMNPELQEIQRKYQNRRTQEDMLKMQEETTAVYDKYGTSPTGSCLQLFIQMPILFALYAVIWNVPAYVTSINDLYQPVTAIVQEQDDYLKVIDKADEKEYIKLKEYDKLNVSNLIAFSGKEKDEVTTQLSKLDNKEWENLKKAINNADKIEAELATLTDEEWEKIDKALKKTDVEAIREKVEAGTLADSIQKNKKNEDNIEIIETYKKELDKVNGFVGLDLSQSPASMMKTAWWAIIIPVLSCLTQLLSVKLTMKAQDTSLEDNPMGSSMKMMNYTMPIMSAVFCFTFPSGLGLYWVANSAVMIVLQALINKYFENMDVNDIIKKNLEKANAKREKRGLPPHKVATAANYNTKNIQTNYNTSNKNTSSASQSDKNKEKQSKESTVSVKQYGEKKTSSIAAKANLVKTLDQNKK